MTYKEDLEGELDDVAKALSDCLREVNRFINYADKERLKNRHSWIMEGLYEARYELERANNAMIVHVQGVKEEDYE